MPCHVKNSETSRPYISSKYFIRTVVSTILLSIIQYVKYLNNLTHSESMKYPVSPGCLKVHIVYNFLPHLKHTDHAENATVII